MSFHGFAPPPPKRPAPPRFQSRLPPPPMPALPADVLSRIITHTLPRSHHLRAFTKRYKLLREYSLVCRAWRTVSQALLHQHVHLPRPKDAFKFKSANVPLGALIGRGAQTLRIGAEWESTAPSFHKHGYVLMPLLANMPFLTEMWLEEVTVDPAVLSWTQDLKVLHLREVNLQYPKSVYQWRLPHLHTLYLAGVSVLSEDESFLSTEPLFTPITLPSLTKLFYTWAPSNPPPGLELIGPQLTHLYLFRLPSTSTRQFDQIPPDLFAQLSSLKHLFYDIRYFSDIPLLDTLASPILSLELFYEIAAGKRVEGELVQLPLPDCLVELEVLFLPPPPPNEVKINSLQMMVPPEWREKLEEWIEPAEVREIEEREHDIGTDWAAKSWLRRTTEVVATEKPRPAPVAREQAVIIVEDEQQQSAPIPDGFVDDSDDEEMNELQPSGLDILAFLRNDAETKTDNFYDAEADDELDGEPIEIR
ncbi:hypothetical protein BCR35DRAFT_351145 [Leucosporidium creatinivorum]|uniref:F-box domain-containing protein n=1 Tax=Leucosporidium creatinivorum TaxID=106004 RepID=A0A1Y2FYR5_9BASI|nr:hypothetical protein BCR35DRAFT_351145 [Leucosporidium creatinivorum]